MKVFGSLRVPGDKSISHRALIFGALGTGESRVTRILQSADVHSTAGVLRSLGVSIPELSEDFTVRGLGRSSLRQPTENLDCGNSGTTTRLMAGVVAASKVTATFVGDASLSKRPMRRVATPLEAMGAQFDLPAHGGLPMTITGGSLHDIEWNSEVASAQIKSAILLAALVSGVRARVTEPVRSRDHTERMMLARGVALGIDENTVTIDADSPFETSDTDVPGDPSSAAFFAGLAALASSGAIRLEGVCVNPTRIGFLERIKLMGASVVFENSRIEGGEAVADIARRAHSLFVRNSHVARRMLRTQSVDSRGEHRGLDVERLVANGDARGLQGRGLHARRQRMSDRMPEQHQPLGTPHHSALDARSAVMRARARRISASSSSAVAR
jgi:3-phosphoshikimate 1-carboxyvinyltransferase